MKALTATDFNFPGQKSVYHGKVRDVYNINGEKLVMVATDRISAFDVVLPKGIPFKGQMLNQIAAKFLDATNARAVQRLQFKFAPICSSAVDIDPSIIICPFFSNNSLILSAMFFPLFSFVLFLF